MNTRLLLTSAIAAAVLVYAGCSNSRSSGYPDGSPDTTRRVDDINRNAKDQRDAVDREDARIEQRLTFNERQIRTKFETQRATVANEARAEANEHETAIREIQIQAKHDKDAVDAELANNLRTSSPEKAAELRADAASRQSTIDSEVAQAIAPHTSASERSKAQVVERLLEIDREEAREISALEQERAAARNRSTEKRLEIDRWANEELVELERD